MARRTVRCASVPTVQPVKSGYGKDRSRFRTPGYQEDRVSLRFVGRLLGQQHDLVRLQ